MTIPSLANYPEFVTDTASKLKSLKLWTLKELNLKKSSEAEDLGYLCVIKHSSTSSCSYPGKWIAPDDIPQLHIIASDIRKANKLETDQKKSRNTAFQTTFNFNEKQPTTDKTAKLKADTKLLNEKIVQQIENKLGRPLPLDTADWLLKAPAAFNLKNMYKRLYLHLKLRLTGTFEAYWPPSATTLIAIRLPDDAAKEWGANTPLTLKIEDCCRIMMGGPKNATKEFAHIKNKEAKEQFKKIHDIITRFQKNKPIWFSDDELLSWGKWQHLSGANKNSHPSSSSLMKKKLALLIEQVGIREKNGEYSGAISSQIIINETTYPVTITQHISSLPLKLWKQRNTPNLSTALTAVIANESIHWAQHAASIIEKYPHDAIWHPDLGTKLALNEQEWIELIKNAISSTNSKHPEQFPKIIEATTSERQHAVQVLACSRALPENLADLYPVARSLKRKLILIVGPTNSGKTYQAIERIKISENSVYLGPLRLLALEVRDTLEEKGVPTSLVTGELIEKRENARCASCTVEMLDFEQPVEVAVIDEVHMLGDPQRGSAWLQAVLGAPASEVWMLGAPEAEDTVRALAKYMGEPLEVRYTERLAPLTIDTTCTPLRKIPPQSAVIAFSRQAVLAIASELQEKHGKTCAVIYGALSPEVRRGQAEMFRTGKADIVVATDAIAMGLNLPVRGIYFSTDVKWNGRAEVPVPNDLVWQIAGRAGRYGQHEKGHVGALDNHTLTAITRVLAHRPKPVTSKYAHGPSWPLVKMVSEHLNTHHLVQILNVFISELKLSHDRRFHSSIGEDQLMLAKLVDQCPLELRTKLTLSVAPVPMSKTGLPDEFINFVKAIADNKAVLLADNPAMTAMFTKRHLETAENAVKMLTLYCWLHYRFDKIFPDLESAVQNIKELNIEITEHLKKQKRRVCVSCNANLPWTHQFPKCESCFHSNYRY